MRSEGVRRVGAVILAAGKSARMGEAKQLLQLGGATVLGRTMENVRAADVDEVVVVLGASAGAIREQLAAVLDEAKVVVNPEYETGMASSLRAGVAVLSRDIEAALIVLGDQPFVRPDTVNRIIEEYRRTGAQIVIPKHEGARGNPVLLDPSLFAEVMALEGDVGCRAIFGKHPDGIVYVEVDDPGVLMDIDSREDYERLRRAHSGQDQA
ncbi:MAG: molybdenum cofactor cytidylyltransferase [Deltaproteobacteria bacterium]|nr:molybdenum cofactor cytidylyltransferase [Deltaproteobacteria bacterium]